MRWWQWSKISSCSCSSSFAALVDGRFGGERANWQTLPPPSSSKVSTPLWTEGHLSIIYGKWAININTHTHKSIFGSSFFSYFFCCWWLDIWHSAGSTLVIAQIGQTSNRSKQDLDLDLIFVCFGFGVSGHLISNRMVTENSFDQFSTIW